MDRSECEARPGIMWVARAHGGNEGMLMVHVCVECTHLPLGRRAMMGLVVVTMLVAGASAGVEDGPLFDGVGVSADYYV
jgi:hypothetical protein